MQQIDYNPETRSMKVVAGSNSATNGRSQVGISWYAIQGTEKKTLLEFARADGLDMTGSNPRGDSMLEGRACNLYVERAVQEFIDARKASDAKKAEAAKAALEAEAQKPAAEVKAEAKVQVPAEAQRPVSKPTMPPKPAQKPAAPVAAR